MWSEAQLFDVEDRIGRLTGDLGPHQLFDMLTCWNAWDSAHDYRCKL
jgi:hypothetical protein